MSRRPRIHVPGGTYYVVQRGSSLNPIFQGRSDRVLFTHLLSCALLRTRSELLAFCWSPLELHFAFKVSHIPLGYLMQRVTSLYARGMHRRHGNDGCYFPNRYKTTLVEPNYYLLPLVRYIHHLPELHARGLRRADFVTSHAAYLDSSVVPWLNRVDVLSSLAARTPPEDYATLMSNPPTPEHIALFRQVGSNALRAIGQTRFLSELSRAGEFEPPRISLEQIIRGVCRSLDVDRAELSSPTRNRKLILARSLIAWQASQRGVASITSVAKYFHRTASTLSHGISRYRARYPAYFSLTAFSEEDFRRRLDPRLVPLGPSTLTFIRRRH